MEKVDEKQIVDRVTELLKSCKTCGGKVFYTGSRGFAKRCNPCFQYEIFLYRFKAAKIDAQFIDITFAEKLRQMMAGNLTFYIVDPNIERQRKWANSAAYMATRLGLKTWICWDKDVVDTVFNNADTEEGASWKNRFIEPQFMVIFLATVVNKNFIGSHIMEIFWERERNKRFTVIIAPTTTKVRNYYNDASLDYFLNDELKHREPEAVYVNHSEVQKVEEIEKELKKNVSD